jgi:hypothetical protein
MPLSHLYARGFRGAEYKSLTAVVRFHERPPGALGGATLSAAVLALFVLALGWLTSNGTDLHSDIPVVLLALPGVSAALLGQNIEASTLRNTSLTTRIGLILTLMTSLAASVVYLAQSADLLLYPGANVGVLGIPVPITDYLWLVLGVVSFAIWVWLAVNLGLRMRTYRSVLSASTEEESRDVRSPGEDEDESDAATDTRTTEKSDDAVMSSQAMTSSQGAETDQRSSASMEEGC